MSGNIVELKAMMAQQPTATSKVNNHHQHPEPTEEVDNDVDETTKFVVQNEHKESNHVSVADILQRKEFRQTSASTFLCPDNIPGKKKIAHWSNQNLQYFWNFMAYFWHFLEAAGCEVTPLFWLILSDEAFQLVFR